MINKISKRATKVMCVVLTAAMLMSDFGITSVSATELSEQEAVSELFSSEEQAEEQTAVSESKSEPRIENDREEAVSLAESEAATTAASTEMTDESSETEKFEIQETQETQTPETDTEVTTEEETMAVGDSSDTDFEYDMSSGTIIKYTGSASELVIPDQIDDIPVTNIGRAAFEGNENLVSIVIPDTVTVVGDYAFKECVNLSNVKLPKSLRTLGTAAFSGCKSLKRIEIPASLEDSGYWNTGAFYGTGLKEVSFESGTSRVADNLFLDCVSLEEISLPDTITVIEAAAFKNCTNLKKVEIPQNAPMIEIQKSAFEECSQLMSIAVPDSATNIGEFAFINCINLSDVKLPKSLRTLGTAAFSGCKSLKKIEIPASLEDSGYWKTGAFYGTGLKEVSFESGTSRVADNLFLDCVSLEEISLPDTITVIEAAAFKNCTNLKKVEIPQNAPMIEIQKSAFEECSQLMSIAVPDSATNIGEFAFINCINLSDVKLPKSLKTMGTAVFSGCKSLKKIEIPASLEESGYWKTGAFYGTGLKEVSFESGTSRVADNLFLDCVSLEEISLPDTITVIEEKAFKNCTNLKKVEIPQNAPMIEIQKSAFEECSQLMSIAVPDSATNIGEFAFINCINLSDVKLPKSLKTMGTAAFSGCKSLKKIEIPASLEESGYWKTGAFYGTGLKEVSFESGTSRVADNLFLDCVSLEEISLPYTITIIEGSAFENCSNLSRITIPHSVEVIQRKAFSGCDHLREITLPVSVAQIADNAFSNPQTLTIYGVTGSYAEEYAAKIGARFVGRNIQAEQVTITPDELCIAQGAQATLTIHVTPADFTDNVTWKTSDETIVPVSQNGIVTAKKIGEATVTVTVGTVSATCKVSVQNPVKSIVLNKTSVQIETAKTVQLTVTVLPENAANQQIGWSSSDETIAKVDENGIVTAVAEGSATITATALDGSGISAECIVVVVKTGTEIKTVDVPVYKTVILNTGNGYADKTINAAINGLKDNVLEVLEVKGVNKNAQKVQGDLEITADGGNVKIGINHAAGAIKGGTFRFAVTVIKKDGGEGSGILTIKITSSKPTVTYKSSGSINVLDREHTQVRFKPTIRNYTDTIKKASISGISEGLFTIAYEDDGYITVKANKDALIALKPPYKTMLKIELESGVTLEKKVSISVKQPNPGVEKTNVISVTDAEAGAVTLTPKKQYARIAKVELAKEDKTFYCVDEGNGKIKIRVKENPEKEPIANKKYNLRLKVTFTGSAVNAKPVNIAVKVQYKE